MMVTLFCDASYCHDTRAGGWGAWAKADGWAKGETFGGALPFVYTAASEAELAAIACATDYLTEGGVLAPATMLMVQTDSARALQVILSHIPGATLRTHRDSGTVSIPKRPITLTPREEIAVSHLTELMNPVTVLCRHVRGHRKGDNRQWVNRTCDDIAKKYMRAQRATLSLPGVTP